jgi:hypothetical protein
MALVLLALNPIPTQASALGNFRLFGVIGILLRFDFLLVLLPDCLPD